MKFHKAEERAKCILDGENHMYQTSVKEDGMFFEKNCSLLHGGFAEAATIPCFCE